jgi:hypothetical protein
VLRRIFGSKRVKVIEHCRKLHNEEVRNVHCSPNNFRVMKRRMVRWTGHAAHMGEIRNAFRILF